MKANDIRRQIDRVERKEMLEAAAGRLLPSKPIVRSTATFVAVIRARLTDGRSHGVRTARQPGRIIPYPTKPQARRSEGSSDPHPLGAADVWR